MKDACIQRIEGVKPSSYRVARSGCKPHMTPAARYAAMPGPGKKDQGFITINRTVHRNTKSNGEDLQGNTTNLAETRVPCQCESLTGCIVKYLRVTKSRLKHSADRERKRRRRRQLRHAYDALPFGAAHDLLRNEYGVARLHTKAHESASRPHATLFPRQDY